MVAFLVGALTSMLSGWIGMKVAVYANARTTIEAASGKDDSQRFMGAFNMAFRAGGVMGFSLCGLGLLVLWCLLFMYKTFVYPEVSRHAAEVSELNGSSRSVCKGRAPT